MSNYDVNLLNKFNNNDVIKVFDNDVLVLPLLEDKKSGLDIRERDLAIKTMEARLNTPMTIESIRKTTGFPNLDISNIDISIEEIEYNLNNILFKAYRYETNSNKDNKPLIIYVHGGSYFAGSAKGYENIVKYLVQLTDAVAINIEYSLAPEYPFPTAYNQVKYVIENLINNPDGFDNKKVVLLGDSCGAQIIASLSMELGKDNISLIGLLYPTCTFDYIDHPFKWDINDFEIPEEDKAFIIPRLSLGRNDGQGNLQLMMMIKQIYLQTQIDDKDYRISPMYGNIKNMPKTLIFTAEYDGLRQQGEYFASILTKNGIENKCYRYKGIHHGFIEKLGYFPQAEDALIKIAKEINNL